MSRILLIVALGVATGVFFSSTGAVAKLPPKPKVKHTSKLSAPMSVRVELSGPPPQNVGDEYDLVGVVHSGKAVKGVRLQWQLGQVASHVAGALNQTIDLEPGKEVRTQLKVKALQLGAIQVRLDAVVGSSEARLSTSNRVRNSPLINVTTPSSGKKQSAPLPNQDTEKKPKIFQ